MPDSLIPSPCLDDTQSVQADWIDLNGHMNVAFYLRAFDRAFDAVYEQVGMTAEHFERDRGTTFAAEHHITYQRELMPGDPLRIATQLLAFDAKRMHWFQNMYHREQGYLAATCEWMVLYVNIDQRRVSRLPEDMQRRFRVLLDAHGRLPVPSEVGRHIDFARRRKT